MAKSNYNVKQADIFGRLGQGIGEGAKEEFNKSFTAGRLGATLKTLGEQEGLSPYQQFVGLASTPGVTPQMIQSGAELLKQQGLRRGYSQGRGSQQANMGGGQQVGNPQGSYQLVGDNQMLGAQRQGGQLPEFLGNQRSRIEDRPIPQNATRAEETASDLGAVRENPLNEKFVPAGPYTQEMYENAIDDAFNRGIATTFPEAQAYAESQKQRYEEAPEKYRAQLDYKEGIDKKVNALYDEKLSSLLQKPRNETVSDLSNEVQENIKKQARNAVAEGRMTPDQAAEFYAKKSLDLAKTKQSIKTIANRDWLDKINPQKKSDALKSLISKSKEFSDMGSSEDYYNQLQQDNVDGGLGLSPSASAYIAYPPSKGVQDFLNNLSKFEFSGMGVEKASENVRKSMRDLLKVMTPNDSFQGIIRRIKEKNPFFPERVALDFLKDNKEDLSLNPRLNREVDAPPADLFPNWGDLALFPL
jgi:hypothetical protein